MSIWFYLGIGIAVALGVHFGLKIHENPQKTTDFIRVVLSWALIVGIIGGVIYLLILGGIFLTHKMREAGYTTGWVIFRWFVILGLIATAFGGGSRVVSQNSKKEIKEDIKKEKHQKRKKESH